MVTDDNIDKDNLKCVKCGRPIYYKTRWLPTFEDDKPNFNKPRKIYWTQCKECNQKFFDVRGIKKEAEGADLK